MEKNIIQSLWIGNKLSIIERIAAASFLANGHKFHLYVYDDIKDVPSGVKIVDANEIIPEAQLHAYRRKYALFSDWFRYELLFKKGHFWVDMDNICLKPYIFQEDFVFGKEDSYTVASGVLRFPVGHVILKNLIHLCKAPNVILRDDSSKTKIIKAIRKYLLGNRRYRVMWGEVGPHALTRELNKYNLFHKAKPFTFFYPIHYSCWKSVFDDTFFDQIFLFGATYSIHLWNEMRKREKDFEINKEYSDRSLIGILRRKYQEYM